MPLYIGTRRVLLGSPAMRYLLRDEFTDTLAAGSVNGTAATPGPGTRTVTDANSKLSVGSGVLSVATGGVSAAEPRISYGSVTRTAGRVVLVSLNVTTEGVRAGFVDAVGQIRDGIIGLAGSTIRAYTTTTAINVGSWSGSTDYVCAIALRSVGEYVFIKGGAFTNWTLLWPEATDSDDPMYLQIAADDSTSVFTCDYIRIPDVLYLPTPIAYDTFTRANGALGSSETTGPDSQSVTARTWNNRVGTTQIATNAASASALVGGIAIATVDTSTINVVMEGTCTRAGNEVGIVLRYADADNYVRAIHDGTNCKLIKRVATVETDVISAAVAIGAGAIVVVADGTSFSLFLNNAKVGSTSTISDAGLQTGTEQGLFSTNTGNTQDGFLVMPRGGGAYSKLDEY